ncbi:MAG: caspase family protein [Bacteroidota bacterium]
MKKISNILLFFLIVSFLGACTSARWTVKEKQSLDKSDSEILEEHYFLQATGEVTPENPVLNLDLYSETHYEYTQRVLMERNIQDYRLRPGAVALGLGGAAMAFYLANSGTFDGNATDAKTWTLNGAGALMLASGFLNMKADGDPRPTGEERLLRNSGTTTEVDTVKAETNADTTASVYMLYNDLVVYEDVDQEIDEGQLTVSLGNVLEELELSGPDPGKTTVEVLFSDSLYRYSFPISSVLQPYAEITNQITPLRNNPDEDEENILADLVQGSQLQIEDYEEYEDWYKVIYGISEAYIKKSESSIIWRSEDFGSEEQVVTVPRVPFGDIDVESNIPILRNDNENSQALLVINQSFADSLEERNYALRDGRLIRSYLENALGYTEENIYQLSNITDRDSLDAAISNISQSATDSTELFVYFSGYGAADTTGNNPELQFLSAAPDSITKSPIFLKKVYEQLGDIPSSQTLVLSDIDFSNSVRNMGWSDNQMRQLLEEEVSPLLTGNPNSAFLTGTRLNDPSSLYVSPGGEDKKHYIFPYYFAKALQERRTTISDIYQYLERNVSYTSRRLFDRPQNPLLLGNTKLNLTTE